MKLTDRTVLITGGSAGIGLALALEFLKRGNQVIVTGRREAVLEKLRKTAPALHGVQSDAADPDQVNALSLYVKQQFPKLDVLVNNAGIMRYRNLGQTVTDPSVLMEEIDINVGGVVRTTSAFIDVLKVNRGTIINVSSALAFVPLPCVPIYSATKAAIHSYTQSLRFQLEDSGIDVFEIMPPLVKTDMTADLAEGDGVTMISADELVAFVFKDLKADRHEILPGQARLLSLMRRLAPLFINKQLWKAAKPRVPAVVA
jgi:uncharacterized oxidoreductase